MYIRIYIYIYIYIYIFYIYISNLTVCTDQWEAQTNSNLQSKLFDLFGTNICKSIRF